MFTIASISEHYHSIAPSTLTSLYAIIGAAVYAYTLYKIQAPRTYLYGNVAAAGSLSALIFLESKSKRNLLLPMDPVRSYAFSSPIRVLTFSSSHRTNQRSPFLQSRSSSTSCPFYTPAPIVASRSPSCAISRSTSDPTPPQRSSSLRSQSRTRLAADISSR